MSTWWQIQIADQEETYAQQAAQAAFAITDRMEQLLSRFLPQSEISAIAQLGNGQRLRLSEPVFSCLEQAREIANATGGAFNVGFASAGKWELHPVYLEIEVVAGPLQLDLGAIGKGFTLDRMAEELGNWGVPGFLLLSSASSILAGVAPAGKEGWPVRVGPLDFPLKNKALGASGTTMRGSHIVNPVTGSAPRYYQRSWALASTASAADALSTAFMSMEWEQIRTLCAQRPEIGAMVQTSQEDFLSAGLLQA